jgi:hypothetical protein
MKTSTSKILGLFAVLVAIVIGMAGCSATDSTVLLDPDGRAVQVTPAEIEAMCRSLFV